MRSPRRSPCGGHQAELCTDPAGPLHACKAEDGGAVARRPPPVAGHAHPTWHPSARREAAASLPVPACFLLRACAKRACRNCWECRATSLAAAATGLLCEVSPAQVRATPGAGRSHLHLLYRQGHGNEKVCGARGGRRMCPRTAQGARHASCREGPQTCMRFLISDAMVMKALSTFVAWSGAGTQAGG